MKKTFALLLTTLILGSYTAVNANQNVAVVDVQAIIEKSAQIQALQNEQKAKMQDLEKWLNTAQADVNKQQTPEGKEKLLKKYNADFAKKKDTLIKDYAAKLQAIDKNITETIATQAKLKGYDIVLSKGAIIYGGDDITEDIKKVVK